MPIISFQCRIDLLNGLSVQSGGRSITRFQTHKTGALLAYLACFPEAPHTREALADLFWPDCDGEAARRNLRVAVFALRRQLEPPGAPAGSVILADRQSVRLNGETVTTDAREFEAALRSCARSSSPPERREHLEEAVDLYHGDLLPDFYEDWVESERERLRALHLGALGDLVRACADEGDVAEALRVAEHAVQANRCGEAEHRTLMQLLATLGQPATAVRRYRELERRLREELDCEPSADLRALAMQLAKAVPSPPSGDPAPGLPAPPGPAAQEASAPTGTVTFLLADLPDRARKHADPERQNALRSQFDDVFKSQIEQWGGWIVKAGRGTLAAAFQSAGSALACALAGRAALAGDSGSGSPDDCPLRLALDTGDAHWAGGHYEGVLLAHAGRLLVSGHAGQILCSDATAALLRGAAPRRVQLLDVGTFRLRGLQTPERLWQAEPAGAAPSRFPPPNASPAFAASIPPVMTRFFGREVEIERLCAILGSEKTRHVTLTGPGGSGKTRLSLEVASRLNGAFGGSVWFVPLADVSDSRHIPDAIREVLQLPSCPGIPTLDQVAAAITPQPVLLVLDNFEQLVEAGAPIVQELLRRAPTLTCLVSSRQRLGLAGEREFPVRPLSLPHAGQDPERLVQFEAAQLFRDRAQLVRPEFQVTASNAAAIARLCERLEGIPLALELAAAWARVLTPAQMLERLEQRFQFLVSRDRNANPRHRSLRAAVDWSFDLLPPDLRALLSSLSVFRGGWTLEAAEYVVAGTGLKMEDCHLLNEWSQSSDDHPDPTAL